MGFQGDPQITGMTTLYCPVCARFITPTNIDEVASGEHDGFVYVHDDIAHDESDIQALGAGVQ